MCEYLYDHLSHVFRKLPRHVYPQALQKRMQELEEVDNGIVACTDVFRSLLTR
jgi:hypothetical protein